MQNDPKRGRGRPKGSRVQPPTPRISAEDFVLWQGDLSNSAVARLLGCNDHSVAGWRKNGAPAYVGLACSAIGLGLGVWGEEEAVRIEAARSATTS